MQPLFSRMPLATTTPSLTSHTVIYLPVGPSRALRNRCVLHVGASYVEVLCTACQQARGELPGSTAQRHIAHVHVILCAGLLSWWLSNITILRWLHVCLHDLQCSHAGLRPAVVCVAQNATKEAWVHCCKRSRMHSRTEQCVCKPLPQCPCTHTTGASMQNIKTS